MIKFIATEDTLPLRSSVLRNGEPTTECYFQADDLPTTFHLGYHSPVDEIVSILTCQLESMEPYTGIGYRLRGMATHPEWQGKGIGTLLLKEVIDHLANEMKADYLWCNARRVAHDFYQNLGFEFLSEEFEIPGIGLHRVMYLDLYNKNS
ncbi:GNAT family N-acetyltransferase [Parapedobacter tibetensis]|uniref:GNAT family N-acetyltransferase n=1 Tax=Parapedobacter tibetensis TaxID=2972951 RepID=UPI00214DBC08|nr:GNAT family N-acetyltransferase [Parapedobacter tibetensis]